MTAAFIVLAAGVALHLWANRGREKALQAALTAFQQQHTLHIQTVLKQKNPDLEQIIALADRMAQRIQAPQQAVYEHAAVQLPPDPPAVGFDDDAGYWEARLSKDELAEALMAEETNVAS